MKKFYTLALCVAAVGSMSAQKQAVDQASKLSGKVAQIGEARNLIKGAIENPETANEAKTYYTAGKIEFDAYDQSRAVQTINPNDESVKPLEMGQQLLNGYTYFLQALPLDSVPNEKGQVKPKYSKDIVSKLANHTNDYFMSGANFFNEKKYYPEAYESFMIYADMPEMAFFTDKNRPNVPDADRSTAYFNAGLAAYSGNQVTKSAEAFKKARLAGYAEPEPYIYEIACWQSISQSDSTMVDVAKDKILEVAKAGYEKFGLEPTIFINNMVNSMVIDNKENDALNFLNGVIEQNPDNANLVGLRAFIYDRMGNNDASEADYRKAASLPTVDFETLKNASKKIFRIGQAKWNEIEGASPEAVAARANVKQNYFQAAMDIAEKAGQMNPNDDDLLRVIDSIEYMLNPDAAE